MQQVSEKQFTQISLFLAFRCTYALFIIVSLEGFDFENPHVGCWGLKQCVCKLGEYSAPNNYISISVLTNIHRIDTSAWHFTFQDVLMQESNGSIFLISILGAIFAIEIWIFCMIYLRNGYFLNFRMDWDNSLHKADYLCVCFPDAKMFLSFMHEYRTCSSKTIAILWNDVSFKICITGPSSSTFEATPNTSSSPETRPLGELKSNWRQLPVYCEVNLVLCATVYL